ncbi:BZ3500_MvSof-1268-A1-R1_Chr4-1g06818 [Microbotryum saponariae]|uniref:cystathionine gamma-lyase n=1 Tax=Microbotryum saponariae TaxID=289078 RepID=A0A2X0MB97_9BASI|nr:BZ3500_MvSof-1268-A1-R1_Chr4-1g06818 [Microbotryum saponariae]SDA06475.1 BZ3501_MvSof-1269-A2-R1_Chr4-1g06520 [Microbotryum saponariae]
MSPLDLHRSSYTNGHSSAPTKSSSSQPSFETRAIHIGSEPYLSSSAGVVPSLDLSTTYAQSAAGQPSKGFEYSRSSNPTRLALERLVASLEGKADIALEKNLRAQGIESKSFGGGPAAVAFASGSAATATVVSGLAGQAGHVVSVGDVYGGTSRYMLQVASVQSGVETTFVDMAYGLQDQSPVQPLSEAEEEALQREEDDAIVKRVQEAVRPDTKLIWAETPTNPMLSLVPIALLAQVAKAHSIPLVIDNTFGNPYYQNPLLLGATVVTHSGTKYLGGHSDVISGFAITSDPTILSKLRFLQNAYGNVPSPFDAWLIIRSLKTLAVRSRQHGLNALALATYLVEEAVPAGLVRDVRYPGLKRSVESRGEKRERELAWAQLSTAAQRWATKQGFSRDGPRGFPSGGMVSFHIVSNHAQSQTETGVADAFLRRLKIFTLAESLGGVESLIEAPLLMTHGGVAVERRRELGIDGELIRCSVGLEDEEDLVEDIRNALEAVGAQVRGGGI